MVSKKCVACIIAVRREFLEILKLSVNRQIYRSKMGKFLTETVKRMQFDAFKSIWRLRDSEKT